MNQEVLEQEITSYENAREYFDALKGLGSVPGLDSIHRLCESIGNPQDRLRFIHVAGTNGKGSTCAYLASMLKAAGYRIGRFHSPAVFSELETIRIGDKNISKADFTEGMEVIRKAALSLMSEGHPHPTVFEAETALAFWYFDKEKCDPVILEVGMGGRMDATNIIHSPIAAVLTSVSMDHMAFLGDTLSAIAKEKAGIIKKGTVALTCRQNPDVLSVFTEAAQACGVSLVVADSTLTTSLKRNLTNQRYTYKGLKIQTSLLSNVQLDNGVLALETLMVLRDKNLIQISDAQMQKGMADTKWPGRFELIGKKPLFVIDGAHNENAAERLASDINFHFTNKKIITIMGMLKDKECEKVVAKLTPLSVHTITVTPPHNVRALPAYELACMVRDVQPMVTAVDSIQEAVELSYLLADKDSVILACGSLSFLKELKDWVAVHDRFRSDTHGRSKED